jgi:dTDP-glucose 4,6-dehydratase
MRILVTGGAGFIGSNYVRKIIDGSLLGITDVIVLDKLTYAGSMSNLSGISRSDYKFVEGDICDSRVVRELISKVELVVNFAAESHVDRSIDGGMEFVKTNVLGVTTLLEAMKESNVRTFLQVSTDEVYGSIQEGSWNEESPLLPNSTYAASKASGDLICRSYYKTHGLDVRITRCSNNYGPNQHPEKIIPLFVTNILQNRKLPIYGSGLNIRDWLHVDDHCRGIHLALTKGYAGEVYNIGGGTESTNLELTHKILESMGKDLSWVDYVDDRKGHDFRYSVDWGKAKNQLGYIPSIEFNEGLSETIAWYEKNMEWWRPFKSL